MNPIINHILALIIGFLIGMVICFIPVAIYMFIKSCIENYKTQKYFKALDDKYLHYPFSTSEPDPRHHSTSGGATITAHSEINIINDEKH